VKRGEIWSAATGSGFGSKPRPVVIVQGEAFGDTPNVIVALCTSAVADPDDVRPRIQPDPENGLETVSDVTVDILVTVPRRKFGKRFGQLSAADQARVFSALVVMLGFAE
jgi:mRNA interferase MazF